jgi:hypothetical protein
VPLVQQFQQKFELKEESLSKTLNGALCFRPCLGCISTPGGYNGVSPSKVTKE